MSGTTKVLLGCGIGCGFLMLLACGGIFVAGYFATGMVKEAIVEDPARIRTLTNDIVTIDIPAGLEPRMGFDAKVPVSHAPFLTAAIYANEKQKSNLILMEFQSDMFGKEGREGFQKQIEDSMERQGQRQQQFQVKESKSHETTIHAEAAKFTIAKGVDQSDNNKELWQVMGEFKGTSGPAIFIFRAPLEDYTEEQIVEMLDSMK